MTSVVSETGGLASDASRGQFGVSFEQRANCGSGPVVIPMPCSLIKVSTELSSWLLFVHDVSNIALCNIVAVLYSSRDNRADEDC